MCRKYIQVLQNEDNSTMGIDVLYSTIIEKLMLQILPEPLLCFAAPNPNAETLSRRGECGCQGAARPLPLAHRLPCIAGPSALARSAMAGASRSLSRACFSSARYFSRLLPARVEASASYGRLVAALASTPECDAASASPTSTLAPSPVVRFGGSVHLLFFAFPVPGGSVICVMASFI